MSIISPHPTGLTASSSCAAVAEPIADLSIRPEIIARAFRETQDSNDDIVDAAGFSGYYEHVHPAQAQLCLSLILEAFRKLRCDLGSVKPGQTLKPIKAVESARRQLEFCYGMLQDAGLILIDHHQMTRTDKPVPRVQAKDALQFILSDHAEFQSLNRLVYHVGSQLAEIWSGRTDSVRLMFGSPDARKYLEHIYAQHHPSKAFHKVAEDFMSRLIDGIPSNPNESGPLRILELGAGTGGTTNWLAPLLARASSNISVKYTFTDLAAGLTAQASRKFNQYPFMTFQPQDIEQPPPPELAGTQHIVIAVNAIHATPDMVQSLRNARSWLLPGGIALIMETQERLCWADFVFGVFEGWWKFDDEREHATAGADVWRDAFYKAGFAGVEWTCGSMKDAGLQNLYLATTH